MIIKEINNAENILFIPEDSRERKYLESFPGLLREGLHFFSPGKARVISNLYSRISKYIKPDNIKYTPLVQKMINDSYSLKNIPDTFKFHTKPLSHQLQALMFMYTQGSCGLLLDPGLGKTKIILDFIYLMGFKKVIIVCPKPLLHVWPEEAYKHRPELFDDMYVVKTTDWKVESGDIERSRVLVINYNKAVLLENQLSTYGAEFLGLDEGLIKNYNTDRTKALTRIGRKIAYKCVMSGTLINNSPLDCFAPLRFIEPALIGDGVTKFKDRYAIVARQNRNIVLGFRDMPEIQSILSASCIVMRKAEWLKELPPKKFNLVTCRIEGDAKDCYNRLLSDWMFQYKGESIELENALPRLGKLLQIANGFVYVTEEDPLEELTETKPAKRSAKRSAKRKTLFFDEQPKIQAIHNLIHDKDRLGNRRAIIWFNYQAELEILEKYLIEQKIKYTVVKGGEKDVGSKVKQFNEDPSVRFLLGQAKTINYGVTVLGKSEDEDCEIIPEFSTTISDQIFYSLNFSLEVFLQQQDRIHRIGQTKECNYWIITTNSCIESRVWKALEDKVFINQSLLVDFSKEISVLK